MEEDGVNSGNTIINVNTSSEKNWWKIGGLIGIALALLIGGFFIGRSTVKIPEPGPPIYIPGDTVKQEIPVPYPVEVKVPAEVDTGDLIRYCVANGLFSDFFPALDSSLIINPQTLEDSLKIYMAIANDWVKEREYKQNLFDVDTLGKCDIDLKVANNQLKYLDYTFVPVIKQVETVITYKRKFSPFIGAGLSTKPTVLGQAGMFFEEKYGVSYLYQYDYVNKQHIHGGIFLFKF